MTQRRTPSLQSSAEPVVGIVDSLESLPDRYVGNDASLQVSGSGSVSGTSAGMSSWSRRRMQGRAPDRQARRRDQDLTLDLARDVRRLRTSGIGRSEQRKLSLEGASRRAFCSSRCSSVLWPGSASRSKTSLLARTRFPPSWPGRGGRTSSDTHTRPEAKQRLLADGRAGIARHHRVFAIDSTWFGASSKPRRYDAR